MSLTFIFFKLIKNSQPKAIENAQLKINWLFAEAVAKLYDTLKPNLIFKVASTDHPHINWLLTLISCCAEAILKHIRSHIALKFVVATMCICKLNVMRTLCLIRSRVFFYILYVFKWMTLLQSVCALLACYSDLCSEIIVLLKCNRHTDHSETLSDWKVITDFLRS